MKTYEKAKKITRATFTKEEDMLLFNFVNQYGEDWNFISSLMINRNPRQIRERYRFYLDPSISKAPWTREEDLKLIELIKQYRTSWKKIAESFEGRNEVNVKNRWKYYLSKHCSDFKTNVDDEISINEDENDQIISKFNIHDNNVQDHFFSIENNKNYSNNSLIEEKVEQKKSDDIFRFYRDEDIELSLYSIEPVKLSDFIEFL
jgi:hypothetical protein